MVRNVVQLSFVFVERRIYDCIAKLGNRRDVLGNYVEN